MRKAIVLVAVTVIVAVFAEAHSGSSSQQIQLNTPYAPFNSDGSSCHVIVLTNPPSSPANSEQEVSITYAGGGPPPPTFLLTPGQSTTIECHVVQVKVEEKKAGQSQTDSSYGHPAP